MPYTIASETFRTKKDITNFIKLIKENATIGKDVGDPDRSFLLNLLTYHPRFTSEWVDAFERMSFEIDKDWGTVHITITVGGAIIGLSLNKCVRWVPKDGAKQKPEMKQINKRIDVIDACRMAIRPQIREFLKNNRESGQYRCQIGGGLFPRRYVHVDHNFQVLTFQTMLDTFLEVNRLTYATIELDTVRSKFVLSGAVKKLWEDYHQAHAKLRIIEKNLNLKG